MRLYLVGGLALTVLCSDPSEAQRSRRPPDPAELYCREHAWTAVPVPVPVQTINDAERQGFVTRWWIAYMQCLQANMKSVGEPLPKAETLD